MSTTLAHYEWLIERRKDVQMLLLELYQYLKDNPDLPTKGVEKLVYGHLVAIAFSLWRAIVFADISRDWKEVFKHIELALEKLIEDNSFLFPDERKSASWTVTYYLQNARLRLFWAIDRHAPALTRQPQYEELRQRIDEGFDRDGKPICNDILTLTELLFKHLKSSSLC